MHPKKKFNSKDYSKNILLANAPIFLISGEVAKIFFQKKTSIRRIKNFFGHHFC
jgi:hypothetical protein